MANLTLSNLDTTENLFSDLTETELEATSGGDGKTSTLSNALASGLVAVAASVPVSNVLNNVSVLDGSLNGTTVNVL